MAVEREALRGWHRLFGLLLSLVVERRGAVEYPVEGAEKATLSHTGTRNLMDGLAHAQSVCALREHYR
jgi:hypothetical protein